MSQISWTFEKDELLIELVKSKPGLYDLQSAHYSDNIYKRKMWNEIEHVVELKGAKIRWESLRAQYRKYIFKLKTKSGQAATKIMKWRYSDQMRFLEGYITVDRARISSVVVEEMDSANMNFENSEDVVVQATSLIQSNRNEEVESAMDSVLPGQQSASASTSYSSNQRKNMKRPNLNPESASSTLMKYILENKKSERPLHPIDQFFSLMATSVKKISQLDQHVVKTKVFSLVSQIEEKYLTAPSPESLSPAPIQQSQNSPALSSQSSSSHVLDIVQSSPHDASREFPTPASQHTYMHQNPANLQSYHFNEKRIISPEPHTSYYDNSSALQKTQYSSKVGHHEASEQPY